MLAPHAVGIAVIISKLIASLSFTFAKPELIDNIFLFVKLCIGQRKYKQNFTTQGTWVPRYVVLPVARILQNSRKNIEKACFIVFATLSLYHEANETA